MTTTIRAIETNYKGYRFRSRLEARWAVFFDRLGIRWQFEPEGFDLKKHNLGYYLPDFYLPDLNYWIEVKPENFSREDEAAYEKLACVAVGTNAKGLLVAGEPYLNVEMASFNNCPALDSARDKWWLVGGDADYLGTLDGPYLFCVCPLCDKIGIAFDGRGDRVCRDICKPKRTREEAAVLGFWGNIYHGDKAYSGAHPMIAAAAKVARGARFEHGERGA